MGCGKAMAPPTGTTLVKDIVPGADNPFPHNLTTVGNTLYFVADDRVNGYELWKSDGTATGTTLVKDIRPGEGSSSPYNLTAVGNTRHFIANDGVNGYGLWKSDGTATGTTLVKDIRPGVAMGINLTLARDGYQVGTPTAVTSTVSNNEMSASGIKGISSPAQPNTSHDEDIAKHAAFGATHYRYAFEIGWGTENLQHVAESVNNAGMKLILCVFREDRALPSTLIGAREFADTCKALIDLCPPGVVTHLEVWNEPNHYPFVLSPNPTAFAQLVVKTSEVVKIAYPTIKIISGGLSPDEYPNDPYTFFLNCVKANKSFLNSIDYAGWHPYSFPHSPLSSEAWNAMHQAVKTWKKVKSQYGKTLQFAATEFGAPSETGSYTEASQSRWMTDYFTAFATRGPLWY